ncbi:MAG TPA: hypothetical protein VNK41_04760 [Vicinamibacterales bacterium]|nr:hypothetical protein [Vicinamibacterales bacterium]
MEAARNLSLFAPLLLRPTGEYHAHLDRARCAADRTHPEAARHLGLFAERLRGLGPEELDELHRETFTLADQAALGDAAAAFLKPGERDAMRMLPVFERLLPSLAEMRNPFTLLFKALCCLLIEPGASVRPVAAAVHPSSAESE